MTTPSPPDAQNAPALQEAAERYAAAFTALSATDLDGLDGVMADDVQFRDPFNDVVGRDRVKAILAAMYRDLDQPRFCVTDVACSADRAYLRWTFDARIKRWNKPWRVEGMTELAFGPDGRAIQHLDHWDSGLQFYAELPVVGALIRFIRRRAAAH